MSDANPRLETLRLGINRAALVVSALTLAAIAGFWWRDRTRHWETPRWEPARFARVSPAAAPGRTTWIVAANPECSHCRARLAELLRHPRDPARDPALGVLLVDVPRRPEPPEAGERLDGGVYWDSLGVWRSRWGHRVYGEVLVFAPDGALERVVPPEADPEIAASH